MRAHLIAITCVLILGSLAVVLGQTPGAKIELKAPVTKIDKAAGTFVIESLKVSVTPTTVFEDLHDRKIA